MHRLQVLRHQIRILPLRGHLSRSLVSLSQLQKRLGYDPLEMERLNCFFGITRVMFAVWTLHDLGPGIT